MAVDDVGRDASLRSLWTRITEGLDEVNSSVADFEKIHGDLRKIAPLPNTNDSVEIRTPFRVPREDQDDEEDPLNNHTNRRRSVTLDIAEVEKLAESGEVRQSILRSSNRPGSSDTLTKTQRGSLEIRNVHTGKSGLLKHSDSVSEFNVNPLWDLSAPPFGSPGDECATQAYIDEFVAGRFGKYFTFADKDLRKVSVGSWLTTNRDRRKDVSVNQQEVSCACQCQAMHPFSRLRLSWDVLSVFAVCCDLIILPLVFAFDGVGDNETVVIVDWITAVFWSLDMIASCITGYHVGANVETNLRRVARNYMMTWFLLDSVIVASEWYGKVAEGVIGLSAFRASRIVRFLRILRFARLVKLVRTMNKIQDVTSSAQLVIIFSVAKMSAVLMYVVHILACGWYMTGNIDHLNGVPYALDALSGGGNEILQGWVYVADARGMDAFSLTWGYMASFRWTISQLNGRTDREDRPIIEMVYTGATATFALLFMSIFVGGLTSRMLQLQQLIDKESGYLRILKKYTESNELSWKTIYIAKKHIRDRWTWENNTNIESTLLSLLPAQTQLDLLFEVRTPVMSAHPFFKLLSSEFSPAIRETLAEAVVSESARSMETIFEKNVQSTRLVFVEDGSLLYSRNPGVKHWLTYRDIEQTTDMRMTMIRSMKSLLRGGSSSKKLDADLHTHSSKTSKLGKGRWVCEASLWSDHWYTQGVLISTFHSKLVAVDRDKFAKVMARHADAHIVCSYYARGFLQKLEEGNAREGQIPSDIFTVELRDAFGVEPAERMATVRSTQSSQPFGILRDSQSTTNSHVSHEQSVAPEHIIRSHSGSSFQLSVAVAEAGVDPDTDMHEDDRQCKFSL